MTTFKSIALRITAAALSLALVGGSMSMVPANSDNPVTPIVMEADAATNVSCAISNLRMSSRTSSVYRFSVHAKAINVPSGVSIRYYKYYASWQFYTSSGSYIGSAYSGWTYSSLSGGTTMISPNVRSMLKGKGTVRVKVSVVALAVSTSGKTYGSTDRSWSGWRSAKFYSL